MDAKANETSVQVAPINSEPLVITDEVVDSPGALLYTSSRRLQARMLACISVRPVFGEFEVR